VVVSIARQKSLTLFSPQFDSVVDYTVADEAAAQVTRCSFTWCYRSLTHVFQRLLRFVLALVRDETGTSPHHAALAMQACKICSRANVLLADLATPAVMDTLQCVVAARWHPLATLEAVKSLLNIVIQRPPCRATLLGNEGTGLGRLLASLSAFVVPMDAATVCPEEILGCTLSLKILCAPFFLSFFFLLNHFLCLAIW
jgi:hypothetical protein